MDNYVSRKAKPTSSTTGKAGGPGVGRSAKAKRGRAPGNNVASDKAVAAAVGSNLLTSWLTSTLASVTGSSGSSGSGGSSDTQAAQPAQPAGSSSTPPPTTSTTTTTSAYGTAPTEASRSPDKAEAAVASVAGPSSEGVDSGNEDTRRSAPRAIRSSRRRIRPIPYDYSTGITTAKAKLRNANAEESVGVALEVYEDGVKGKCVRACEPIARNAYVCEYAGDLISEAEAEAREARYAEKGDGCYMYYFKHGRLTYCVDATHDRGHDGFGRLINHSRLRPNLRTIKVVVDEKPRLIFLAGRDIDEGEELLYDYGDRESDCDWLNST